MKKIINLFALAALLLLPSWARATVDSITVANGTTTDAYIPIYGYYVDAAQHNQVIYPEDSLTAVVGSSITHLTFYMSQVATGNWNTNVTLRMGIVTDTSVPALITTAQLNEVWQGNASGQVAVWEIELDEPFLYNGGNLLLDIQTTIGSWKSASFYGVARDDASFYHYNTVNSSRDFLPKTKFQFSDQPVCRKPQNIAFSDVANDGFTVSWTTPAGDNIQNYSVWIGGVEVATPTDTFYSVSGLEANTTYNVSVRTVCGPGDTSGVLTGSAKTLCQYGNCALQVLPASSYTSGTYYNPTIAIIQGGEVVSSSNQTVSVQICNGDSVIVKMTNNGGSSYYTPSLQVVDAGGTYLFDGSLGSYSNGDIVLALANGCPSCIPPVSIHQTPTDPFSTTIHWTDQNVDGLGEYVLVINGVEYPVSGDSSYTLATWPLTHYDVSVARICDGDDTSAFRTIGFNAPCDESVYAEVPFFSGFEELNTNESPDCWVQVQTGGNASLGAVFPSAYRWANNAHTGSVYFEFESANGSETEVLALPRMQDVSTLQLSFYAATTSNRNGFMLEAGVIEVDDTGGYIFVPVDTVDLYAGAQEAWSTSYRIYNILFDTYTGTGERLAIRTTPTTGSMYTMMIDDFNVIRVGVPALGPFEHASYSINMGDTLTLTANLMTGEVDTWTWTSDMLTSGDATIVEQDSNTVRIVYNAAGLDILTVTASNANGSASKSVTVNVIDNSLVSTYPYSTGFEPGEDRSWYTDGDFNGWYIGSATSYDESGTSLYISRDNGASNMMADGLTCRSYAYRHFDMGTGGEYMVNFWWKGNGAANNRYMQVYLAQGEVNPTHGSSPSSSWTRIATCNAANDWTEFSDVVDADTGVHTLIFYWYGTGNVNPPHAVDNITVDKLNCSRVGHLTVSNVLAHSADISWTPRNGESSWYIQVDSAEGYDVADTMVTLTGFAGESHHVVTVRALCDGGDSSFASTVEFTTTISCPAVRDIHTSEVTGTSATIEWTRGGEETAWKVSVDGGDTVDVADTSYTVTGLLPVTSHTIMVMADCGVDDGQSLPSNFTFNTLCDEGTCDIFFNLTDSYSGMDGWNGGAIRVVQNGVEVGSATILTGSNAAQLNIPVCSAMPVALVFTAGGYPSEMGGTVETIDGTVVYTISGMTASMDDDTLATVETPCPTCMPATNLVVDAVTANTCTISWQSMGSNNGWAVYQNGTQVGGVVTDTTYTFANLDANTDYTFGVCAICEDNDSSAVRTVSARTDCANGNCEFSIVMTDSYGDGWNNNRVDVYQNGSLFESATITTGSSATANITPCLGDPIVLIWHSGNFSYETSFSIVDANDSTLLEISNATSSPTACNDGDTLVVFDGQCNATVVFVPGSTPQPSDCNAPTNVTANATENSVTVSFTAMSYVDGYEVEIVAGNWVGSMNNAVFVNTNTYTFNNLDAGTSYTVAVRTVCDSDYFEYSDWTTVSVTTTETVVDECDTPTDVDVVEGTVSQTSATIRWTENGSATKWEIKVRTTGFDSVYTATSNPYTVNGLQAGRTYTTQVRAFCADTLQSSWSDMVNFQTQSGNGIDGVDMLGVTLFPNPASSMVTIMVAEKAEVSLIDLNGRVNGTWSVENGELTVDVSTMAQGTYFVRVVGESGVVVRKLVIK